MVGEQAGVARITAPGFDQFGQRQRVAQAEVEALRADRMQGLCGIADQHRARRDGLPGHRADGRIDAARADRKEAADAPAERALDRKSTRLNSSHYSATRNPSSA